MESGTDQRDPASAEPLRALLGYTSVPTGVSDCRNIFFTQQDKRARGGPWTRPCSTTDNPKPAEWSRKGAHGRGPVYLCRDCVPRCLYDGLPTEAFAFAADRVQLGWRVTVVEGERGDVHGIELMSIDPRAGDTATPPDIQAAWQRYVFLDGQWLLDIHEIRGWGVNDTGTFSVVELVNNNLFPAANTTG